MGFEIGEKDGNGGGIGDSLDVAETEHGVLCEGGFEGLGAEEDYLCWLDVEA